MIAHAVLSKTKGESNEIAHWTKIIFVLIDKV